MAKRDDRSCPICEAAVPPRGDNEAFPFCSPRCRLIDLGNWLDGGYKVAGELALDHTDDGSSSSSR